MNILSCVLNPRRLVPGVSGLLLVLMASLSYAEGIPQIAFSDLSDQDLSPLGRMALSHLKDEWKHAESEHFVYHFSNEKEAETFFIHAELYYGWIKDMFGVTEDRWKKKCHIYVFEDKAVWETFRSRANAVFEGADAFTTGWELFIYRSPFWLSPKKTLAHELTHLIVFRFLDGPLPLFLNEGFAEYMSYRAIATQFGGDEYQLRTLELLSEKQYTALSTLAGLNNYPSQIESFYRESELVVRFLIQEYSGNKFYDLLRETSRGTLFSDSLNAIYGISLESFEEKFITFAVDKHEEKN